MRPSIPRDHLLDRIAVQRLHLTLCVHDCARTQGSGTESVCPHGIPITTQRGGSVASVGHDVKSITLSPCSIMRRERANHSAVGSQRSFVEVQPD